MITRTNVQAAGIIGLVSTLIIGTLWWAAPNFFQSWERTTYDVRLRWQGGGPVHPGIVLIPFDKGSNEVAQVQGGPRAMVASIINALGNAQAKVIGLDFVFSGESPPHLGGTLSDEALVEAIRSTNKVIIPLDPETSVYLPEWEVDTDFSLPPNLKEALAKNASGLTTAALQSLPVAKQKGILPALMESAYGLGHISTFPEEDKVHRKYPVLLNAGGYAFPSLGLSMVATYLDVSPQNIEVIPGEKLVIPQASVPNQGRRDLAVPLDRDNSLLIRYAGHWMDSPFEELSLSYVWDLVQGGNLDDLHKHVKGKIVLFFPVGNTSKDWHETPLDPKAPGGFIHANVMNSILLENAFQSISPAMKGLLSLILACLSAFVLTILREWKGLVGVSVLALCYVGVALVAMSGGQLVFPVMPPLLALVLASGGTLGWLNRSATHQVMQLKTEILEAKQELKELNGNRELLVSKENRVEELEEELERLRTKTDASGEVNQQRMEEIDRFKVELNILRSEANTASELNQQKTDRIKKLEVDIDYLNLEADKAVAEIKDSQEQVDSIKEELREAESETEAARQRIQELEDQLARVTPSSAPSPSMSSEELETLRQEAENQLKLITRDVRVLGLLRNLKKVANSDDPILILGETGTGKEVFANATHKLSGRSGDFVAVNVSILQKERVGSELFGHERGAFTGAHQRHEGFFERAMNGTIFLDEIGELPLDIQTQLLRVLQEGEFERMGGNRPIRANVRVISATNQDLRLEVAEKRFRADLFYRLQGMQFHLPPLRERREDLVLLAHHFVGEYLKRSDRTNLKLSKSALAFIHRWDWPGNIRELQNRLKKAVQLAEGKYITEEHLLFDDERQSAGGNMEAPLNMQKYAVEGDLAVLQALRQHAFDMTATAKSLGKDRGTVTGRLKGLCFVAMVEHSGDRYTAAAAIAGTQALTRMAESKLNEYMKNLMEGVDSHTTAESAFNDYRSRCGKNFPYRFFPAVKSLYRTHFGEGFEE